VDGLGLRAIYDHLQDFSGEGGKITSIIQWGKTDMFLCRLCYEFNLKKLWEAELNSFWDCIMAHFGSCFESLQTSTQTLGTPWPAVEKRELWEHYFEIAEFFPSVFTAQSAYMAHAWNGCSQSSRFPTADRGERRLWERDWNPCWRVWSHDFSFVFIRPLT